MTEPLYEQLASVGDVEPGQCLRRVVRGRAIALCNVHGQLYAIDDRCTHGSASLSEGWLEGCEIECPLHQGRFDVTSGRATAAPCVEGVQSFPIRIEGDRVLISVPDDEPRQPPETAG
jgi:naphthalene 1,2-dioxygenase system ferredoxin subunit